MFAGLVDQCGEILSIKHMPLCATMWISSHFKHLQLGESITVDGTCLTIIAVKDNVFACELSPETLRLTVAYQYIVGNRVNLERSLSVGDRLGGHFVSGHIDQTITVTKIQSQAEFTEIHFTGVLPVNQNYLIPKGSVAINGISLTVNSMTNDHFTVMLIPHTLRLTNLADLKIGQRVNVEFDLLAKMITRQLQLKNEEKSIHGI